MVKGHVEMSRLRRSVEGVTGGKGGVGGVGGGGGEEGDSVTSPQLGRIIDRPYLSKRSQI